MGQTGIGHAGYEIHVGERAPGRFVPGHDGPVAVAHDLHVDPFVVGVGIAVVGPEEGADAHLVSGGGEGLPALLVDADNFPGTQFVGVVVPQFVVGEGLEGDAAALVVLPHQYGKTAQPVPGSDDLALAGENQKGEGTLDEVLGVENAGDQVLALVDKGRHQFGGVDLAGAHGHELGSAAGKEPVHQVVRVVDDTHGGDGVNAEAGADHQRLGVRVADAADAGAAVEASQILLEFGPEGGVLNGMNLTLESVLPVEHDHAATPGAQMGVIVHAEENVERRVPLRDRAKKSAHKGVLLKLKKGPPAGRAHRNITGPSGAWPFPDRRPPRCPDPGGSGPCPASLRFWRPRSGRCRG